MANKNNVNKMNAIAAPTAPPPQYMPANEFQHRAPPPSYEESQRQAEAQSASPASGLQKLACGYTNPYQVHIQQQQMFYQHQQPTNVVMSPATSNNGKVVQQPAVLKFARGAVLRKNANGAITVPPPPPGCVATPAQLAAMQGQPVQVKKKGFSFF